MAFLKKFGVLLAGAAASVATPALANTYDLGTLPTNVRVFRTDTLGPSNTSNTYIFNFQTLGDLGHKLFSADIFGPIAGLSVDFYQGVVGSGTLISSFNAQNTGKAALVSPSTGGYYAVVDSAALSQNRTYQLQLYAEGTPAPAPGPAGLLVFAAGAAVMGVRKRRANKAKQAAA